MNPLLSNATSIKFRAFYLLLVTALIAWLIWQLAPLFSARAIFFAEDQGLTFAVAERILHGEFPLLGPPSHVGGRHLGPLLYWVTAAVYWICGEDVKLSVNVFGIITILSALSIIWLAALLAHERYRPFMVLGGLMALCCGDYPALVQTAWQSNFLFAPVALFLWSARAVFLHRPGSCWWLLVTSTILIQAHFSTAPLVIGVGCVLFTAHRAVLIASLRCTWSTLIAGALTLLLWTPAVWYELQYGHNLSAVFKGLLVDKQHAGFAAALAECKRFILGYSVGRAGQELLIANGLRAIRSVIFPLLLGMCGVAFIQSYRAGNPARLNTVVLSNAGRDLFTSTFIALLIYLVLLARQEIPLSQYYLNGLLYLPLLLMGLTAAQLFACIHSYTVATVRLERVLWGVFAVFMITLETVLCAIALTSGINRRPAASQLASFHSLEHIQQVASGIELFQSEAQRNRVEFYARGTTGVMTGAVNFFRGPQYYSTMPYADWMIEMPTISIPPVKSSLGFLELCPKVEATKRQQIWTEFASEWKYVRHRQIPNCLSCRRCAVVEMTRR